MSPNENKGIAKLGGRKRKEVTIEGRRLHGVEEIERQFSGVMNGRF